MDDWCNARDFTEFPESLITAPPPVGAKTTVKSAAYSAATPVEAKTTVKSAAYSLHSWSIFLTFLLLQLYFAF